MTLQDLQAASRKDAPGPELPAVLRVSAVIGAYLLAAIVLAAAQELAGPADFLGVPSMPSAVSLVLLFLGGPAYAPVVFAGTLLIEALIGGPAAAGPAIYILALCPAAAWGLAAIGLRHGRGVDRRLRRAGDVAWFVVAAIGGSFVLTAAAAAVLQWDGSAARLHAATSWFVGEIVEVLVIAPPLLTVVVPWLERVSARSTETRRLRGKPVRRPLRWSREGSILAQIASILAVPWGLVGLEPTGQADRLLFLCLLPVLWVALAHGLPGASLGALGLALAIASVPPSLRSLFSPEVLQLLMLVVALTGLFAGAVTSERKATAQALRRERNFVSAILDTVDAPIVVIDRDGRLLRFNSACQRISGHAPEDVLGRSFEFLIPPEELDPVRAVFAELLGGVAGNTHVNHWVAKDGGRRLIRWTNAGLSKRGGSQAFVIGAGID